MASDRNTRDRLRAEDVAARLQAVRAEAGYLIVAEFYCDNSDCSARELRVSFKDYDDTLSAAVRLRKCPCPFCGQPLKMHWACGPREEQIRQEQEARCSVNRQMLRRQRLQENPNAKFFAATAAEIVDDRLPPTPDGWFKSGGDIKPRTFVSRAKTTSDKGEEQ